jgi:DNA polymerase
MTKVVSLDFELCSTLDLTDTGTDVWTKHPDTLPILCGFALDYDDAQVINFDLIGAGLNTDKRVIALLTAVTSKAEVHCWNANFEFNVWNNICAPRFSWPALSIERFHCTMSAAACAGLPMSLDDAATAVGSFYTKDKAGQGLMMRMARPRRVDANGVIHWWHREDPIKLEQLAAYNVADVNAERELHARIPRMTKRERAIWLTDQRMNMKGLPVDKALLDKLSELTLFEWLRLDQEIASLTRGSVTGSTQNLKLLAWAKARGYPHDTLEKDTLAEFIGSPGYLALAANVQDVLLARAERAKASAAKIKSITNYSQVDGVARGLIQYGGAVRTLRWAGRGPQIQNFPKPVINEDNVIFAIDAILDGMEPDGLRLLFGRPLDVVSSCLRGVFKAPVGQKFVVCDYTSIEAIVLAWLADDQALLDVFRRGEDVYVYTAKAIGSASRQLGKVLVLACGYGMGHVKFQETAKDYGLTLSTAQAHAAVVDYRLANKAIVRLWHACEHSALDAIRNPSSTFTFKKLMFRMADPNKALKGSLLMTLPSGRNLVYRNARIENGKIVFWGVNQYTRQWCELTTYGGKLVENATQATARDLLAETIVEIDQEFPGTLCTTIHDEIVALTNEDDAWELLTGMRLAMSTPPVWSAGLPLSAKGAILDRYTKL